MTVSLARPGACWVAPKNMVLAGAGATSILLPQLPQNRLPVGISAPQFGQSIPAFSAARPTSQAGPGFGGKTRAGRSTAGRSGSARASPADGLQRRCAHQRVAVVDRVIERR